MFQPVDNHVNFPEQEERILKFWKDRSIYDKSLEKRRGGPKFVFFEGPPTANGMPHPGHCLTRAMKDVFPRYRSMRGFYCERKAGWDTHGLPVEVEVCKDLGIHSKEDIEEFGVEPFIQKCQQSVWRYMQEWERLTERLGFWLKLDEAYVTYHQSYVESVWWSLKSLFDRGLLYQGHKIVWWWAQGGTALSSGEVGDGYREVADPSVYVKFPLVEDQKTSLVIWTTTPWTLPSNQFAAVHPDLEYAFVSPDDSDEQLIVATDLVETLAEKFKMELTVESTCRGSDLIGKRYLPPFDYFYSELGDTTGKLKDGGEQHVAWRVVEADFVTTDSGTGVVHEAPAFGEVDYEVLITQQERFADNSGPQLICAVGPNGKFTDQAPDYAGMWVKDADKPISRALKENGRLVLLDQYLHDYPFCWRAQQDPLIQYPRRSWFIKTTSFKDRMLANNKQINWLPDHIRDGRFGNFLESNVDWALSRERYWGTPLPIWQCSETGKQEAIDSYNELLQKPGVQGSEVWEQAKQANPEMPDDLQVHKPYIDAITYDSPFADGGRMTRVPEVIDCWYDSGAMPFAQWGYPHQGKEQFESQFPADFISEAIDQTRGWFYSLLAISTLLFDESDSESSASDSNHEFPHPFRNCIVLGLMLSEWFEKKKAEPGGELALTQEEAAETFGKGNFDRKVGKMSKSMRNYREPQGIFDRYGADALRWYLFANQPPWTSIRYSEPSIKESIPEFLLRLFNVYGFFVIYANLDGFDPAAEIDPANLQQDSELTRADLARAKSWRAVEERSEIDRWILSELNKTTATVIERMDAYDNFVACAALNEFVDSLSNWYVRRSRDRFWSSDKQSQDKLDAYWTLYECLLECSKLIAPFVPFMADAIWNNLAGVFSGKAVESVHLCDFPQPDATDENLSQQMDTLRTIASLGRSARMESKLRVRQPLSGVTVVLGSNQHQSWLEEHSEILLQELNVKTIDYTTDADQFVDYQIQPNFQRLGQRVRGLMPKVKKLLNDADGAELLEQLNRDGVVKLEVDGETVELDGEDIQVQLQAKEGWSASQGKGVVVVLATELTPELIREGYVRDIIRHIQDRRKELDLKFDDQIDLALVADSEELNKAIKEHESLIVTETLATGLHTNALGDCQSLEVTIGDYELKIFVGFPPK